MKKLLNTLYVTSENSYLSLDGENIVVFEEKTEVGRLPLHNLEGIVSFGYRGTSPALMGACAERSISLCYMTPQGKFLARVTGKTKGNVLLREQQYASSKNEEISLDIARNCIIGKVYNARWVLERSIRDHSLQINVDKVKTMVFVISGALCGIAGVLLTSKVRSGDPTCANAWEMDTIAGAIIGGTNMMGGEGKLGGTIIGLLFVGILANGMVLLGVSAYMQSVIKGLVIFLAVIINSVQKRSQA